jgi:hypothetical protein
MMKVSSTVQSSRRQSYLNNLCRAWLAEHDPIVLEKLKLLAYDRYPAEKRNTLADLVAKVEAGKQRSKSKTAKSR